ncbi:MAG: DNA replication/repair protein RecF [Bacteroidota bacterium]
MVLEKLQLINFKNYQEASLDFKARINVFTGKNGSGKTNLLDAIHMLSFTRSAFFTNDLQHIFHGENHFMIKGSFRTRLRRNDILCATQVNQKKTFQENGVEYQKLSEHIGKYPVVMIAPDDIDLVKEGSEVRRKFFDSVISQMDKPYLDDLILYNYFLKQRNGLLKNTFDESAIDHDLLHIYDEKLVSSGIRIFAKRSEFSKEFLPLFLQHYKFLTENAPERVNIIYRSDLANVNFQDALKKNLKRDLYLQRTSVGIHRDDFLFTIHDAELKKLGSQGQQKSFLIALKLADFQILAAKKELKPIILLDDIFDKLDDVRIRKLMHLVAGDSFGQLFITDTNLERMRKLLSDVQVPVDYFSVNAGHVVAEG